MSEQGGTDPREARRRLVRKSLEDEAFREELLREPKAALERELGTSLPEEVEVRVVEDAHDTVHLVLPPRSAAEHGELSDEDLDTLAGGTATNPFAGCATQGCPP